MEVVVDMSKAAEKRTILEFVRNLDGMHRVEIVKFRPRRSDRANRFYWPAVVQPFADFLRAQGENYTDEQAHELLKFRALRVTVTNKEAGEVIGERVRSTTELNTAEFSDYLENTMAWLADFGIVVQSPEAFTGAAA